MDCWRIPLEEGGDYSGPPSTAFDDVGRWDVGFVILPKVSFHLPMISNERISIIRIMSVMWLRICLNCC